MSKVGWLALAVLWSVGLASSAAHAQIRPLTPSFDLHGGYHLFLSDQENFADNFVGGGRLGLNITPVVAIEGTGQYIQSRALVSGKVADLGLFSGDIVVHLTRGRVVPYLAAGAGAKYYSVRGRVNENNFRRDEDGNALPIFKNPDWDFQIDAAFGVKFLFAPAVGLRLDVRYLMSIGSAQDEGIPNEQNLMNDRFDNLQATVGLYLAPGGKAADRDRDGIADGKDRCPDDPEDFDEFEDRDGCPDPDNDKDGILDVDDSCRDDPETFNKFQDEDGCPDVAPEADRDKDGIPDSTDRCPDDPETFNDFEDEDGCPDSKPQPTVGGEVLILEKVYFETDKTYVSTYYRGELDKVAALMKASPNITRVRVEGHADERSADDYNFDLSRRRAEAVRDYLVSRGVEPRRLEVKPYGEARPVALGHDEDSWSKNRRVEFVILAQ